MNRLEHVLTGVMEECDEVSQRVAKAMRFGLAQVQEDAADKPEQNPERLNNEERIEREFHDLVAMLEMAGLVEVWESSVGAVISVDKSLILAKQKKFESYLERSRRGGTLQE